MITVVFSCQVPGISGPVQASATLSSAEMIVGDQMISCPSTSQKRGKGK